MHRESLSPFPFEVPVVVKLDNFDGAFFRHILAECETLIFLDGLETYRYSFCIDSFALGALQA